MSATSPSSPRTTTLEKRADPNAPGVRNRVRFLVELFSDTAERFSDNEGYRLGAAFSYYATFSIFPLLLLSITIVGFVVGDSASARERLLEAIASPGSPVRDILDRTITAMQENRSARGLSTIIGVGTLLFGASGAFVELDASLNRIWCVPRRESKGLAGSIRVFVLERLSGFAIVLGLGLTLLVSLITSSMLSFVVGRAQEEVSTAMWPAVARTLDLALSMALLAAVFTAAFHLIPRSRPPMRIVARGALLTTIMLSALKELFASYLSHLTSYSAYGVAGGVLALTTWIYLSSMIILFGAQLTRIHAEKVGAVEPCAPEGRDGAPSKTPAATATARDATTEREDGVTVR
ncbi:MAG: YihY/virulence factor BrkB family protein [Labilithrix sp.]|nr:YihY/virulence factor BrkB family protein [Labilithrix sp.]MCW5835710.1 YihY/virulence factor BrkB family protein [Labilithrix sp.]